MCGIWAIFGSEQDDVPNQCKAAYEIKHRGPDAFRLETIHFFPNCAIGFHRLAIVDDLEGMQPMRMLKYPHIWLMYNGEIYNHKLLEEEFGFDMATECDGEVIIHLYVKGGVEFAAKHLDGVFAFLILDTAERRVYVGRDTFGVRPAFKSYIEKEGFLAVCSEAKGLIHLQQINSNVRITPVSPGHVETYSLDLNGKASHENTVCFHRIGQLPAYTTSVNPVENDIEESIRMLLDASVCKRTMAERRIGCLLSGGLASSLVAALFVRKAKRIGIKYPIQTFSIGIKGSQDLLDARKIANHLGTEHHEVHMTPDEIINSLKSIIYHLESYDSMTIQASVGLYLLSKYINEKTDTRVILSGEGAEEVLQSYSSSDDNTENLRLCRDLYMYGGLRADRCTAAWGLEIRDPFLDHRFSSYYISLAPEHKQPPDSLLRAAFANTDLFPKPFPTNKKRSYGISSVQQILHEHPHVFEVSEQELEEASSRYPYNTPCTKEALFYRKVFESFYPGRAEWIPDSAIVYERQPIT